MPRRGLTVLALLFASSTLAVGQPVVAPPLDVILERAGDAVARFYARSESIVSTETVVQQDLRYDLTAETGLSRRLVYERRIVWDAADPDQTPEAHIQRELISANNRPPRPRDKPKCFDKESSTPDLMQMLLPVKRGDYTFTLQKPGRTERRPALVIDFSERQRGPSRLIAKPREGVEGCYDVNIDGHTRGRIWLAPDTYEVLRIDQRLKGPVGVSSYEKGRVPFETTFEREDISTVYRAVTFSDPDETMVLPFSVVMLRVQTGARQRETTTFTNYRRFVTEGRIVQEP